MPPVIVASRGLNPFASFALGDFRWLWISSFTGFMAMQMKQVVQGWLVYSISRSPLALGIVVVAFGLPLLFLAPVGGVLADRMSKKVLIFATQTGNALLMVILGVLVSLDMIQVWHIFVLGMANGMLLGLSGPARQALVPELVDRGRVVNAVSLSTAGMNLSRIVGPALAGALITAISMAGVLYLIAGIYILAVLSLLPIKGLRPGSRRGAPHSMGADAVAGLRYVQQRPLLLTVISIGLLVALLGWGYQNLMPAFVGEALGAGPKALGFLLSVTGVGALVGSLLVAVLGRFPRKGALLLGTTLLYSVALLLFTFSRDMMLASAALFVLGFVGAIFMALTSSLLQLLTSADMYGRVMSINMMAFGLQPLGVLPLSAAAESIGIAEALGIGASLMTAISLGYLALAVGLRRLRAEDEVPR